MPPKKQRVMIKRDIMSTSKFYDTLCEKIYKLYRKQNKDCKYVPCLNRIKDNNKKHNTHTLMYVFDIHDIIIIEFNDHEIHCTNTIETEYMSTDCDIVRLRRLRLECEKEDIVDDFILAACRPSKNINIPALYEYNLDFESWKKRKNLEQTEWDAYVMAQEKKAKITNRIDDFLSSREDYIEHNKNHKLIFLLIGPPGTGKSTLCKLIAEYTNRNMYSIMMDIKISDTIFSEMYDKINNESVIVLEDLDRIYSKQKGDKTTISLSTILNTFDGPQTKQGNIIIITANDMDHFEEALTRSGRIDEVIVFSYICEEECHQSFRIFNCNNFTDNDKKSIINTCKVNNVTTCELTDFLFQNRKECKLIRNLAENNILDWGKLFKEYVQNIRKRTNMRKNIPPILYS